MQSSLKDIHEDSRSSGQRRSFQDQLSGYLSDVVIEHLESPIDELDALTSLLAMAEEMPDERRHGYDIDTLNEIVLRRIRELARICRNRVATMIEGQEPRIDE